jgi:hypothetical protein
MKPFWGWRKREQEVLYEEMRGLRRKKNEAAIYSGGETAASQRRGIVWY